jgi:transposase
MRPERQLLPQIRHCGEAATGAAKTGTFLGERYRRLVKRMPKPKAAIARSILVIVFEFLADRAKRFRDLGPDHYAKRMDTRAPHRQAYQ